MDVELKNVSFSYNPDISSSILNNIDLSVKKGEFALICGKSGAGKTTLAQIAAGLTNPTSGKVLFEGMNVFSKKNKALKKRVGMIFQTPEQQLFERTVFEDVTFVLRREGRLSTDEITKSAEDALTLVGLDFDTYRERVSFSLSTGEKRKAAIACILINSPELIIFDEPTVGLDYQTKKSLIEIIRRLHKQGKTIICITHEIENFLDFSDQILILRDKEVSFSGNKQELFSRYDEIKNDVRFPDMFSILLELKKLGNMIRYDIYRTDEIVLYLSSFIEDEK